MLTMFEQPGVAINAVSAEALCTRYMVSGLECVSVMTASAPSVRANRCGKGNDTAALNTTVAVLRWKLAVRALRLRTARWHYEAKLQMPRRRV